MYAFLEFWYLDLCTAERSFRWVERRSRFFDSVGAERSWEEEAGPAHLSSFLSSQTCGLFRLRHERLFCLIPNILLEAAVLWLWPVDVIMFEDNGLWKAKNKKTIRLETLAIERNVSVWLAQKSNVACLKIWRRPTSVHIKQSEIQTLNQQMTEDNSFQISQKWSPL